MKNSKTIGIAVIILAIMNVALLIFLWLGYQHNQRLVGRAGGLSVLAEQLSLSAEQKSQLEQLRREHFQIMEPLRRQSSQARANLHALWAKDTSEDKIDSLSNRIGELQAQIEKTTFEHFAEIRAICNDEQKRLFDEVIQDVLKQGERPPRQRPGQEGRPPPAGRN